MGEGVDAYVIIPVTCFSEQRCQSKCSQRLNKQQQPTTTTTTSPTHEKVVGGKLREQTEEALEELKVVLSALVIARPGHRKKKGRRGRGVIHGGSTTIKAIKFHSR